MASFPSSIKSFATLTDNVDDVLALHQNERGAEITAIETALKSFTAFSPSWTNLTVGNGTNAGYYTNDGGWVNGYMFLTFGSTTSISGSVSVNLPVNTHGAILSYSIIGEVVLQDTGSGWYVGKFIQSSSSAGTLIVVNASASYSGMSALSSTVPFTWTTNDQILVTFRYKAA